MFNDGVKGDGKVTILQSWWACRFMHNFVEDSININANKNFIRQNDTENFIFLDFFYDKLVISLIIPITS